MKYVRDILLVLVTFILVFCTNTLAQGIPQDSLRNYLFAEKTDIDTAINYQANRLETGADSKIIRLIGNAVVTYKNMTLRAGLITIDMNENSILAEPVVDTSTINNGSKEPALTGFPEFSEGGQRMVGEKMIFNFVTEKGRVVKGRTEFDEGFYRGETLKKTSKEIFYVEGGVFTTCDLDTPHYHFSSGKMKMIQDDRVIARPIVLYIHGIPIMALPYGFFPNRKGRHSGILVPRYGQSLVEGRYLRGLGYYWAASQYWDTKLEVDFFEKTGFMLHSTTNYALRYLMRGSLSGSLLNKNFGNESKTRRWDINLTHSQTLSPTANLSARGSFVSDGSYYRDFSANRQQRLEREIRSNITFNKNWPGSRNSMSINLFRSQNLDTDGITETFPQISFRHGQEALINLFRSKEVSAAGSGSQEKRWYENIYFSYNSQFINRRSKFRSEESQPFTKESFAGIEHTLSFSTPIRLLRYFTLSQNIGYEEIWQDQTKAYSLDSTTNEITSKVDKGFAVRRTFDVRLGINTKIYGIFDINRWGITGLRHVVSPSVSIQVRPDFSDEAFGYYVSLPDTSGNVVKRDRFSGSFFGSTPSVAQRNINFGLNNLFQMKTEKDGRERKIDLFTNSLSLSHNFEADSLKWSRLSSSFRASPSRLFNFTLNMSHSLYKFDSVHGREVNRLLVKENIWSPLRLTSLSLSSSLRIKSTMFTSTERGAPAKEDSTAGELVDESTFGPNRFESNLSSGYGRGSSWSSNLSFSYSENRFNPANVTKSIWLNLDSNIQLTKNWRLQYNARVDLKKNILVAQDISIYRDLHCWEARFVWTPTGPNKRFYFKINIKSALLSDIKLEKRGGRTSVYDF